MNDLAPSGFPRRAEATADFSALGDTISIDFVLLPGFVSLALSAAMEPMLKTNAALGKPAVEWRLLSADGGTVCSREGWPLSIDGATCMTARVRRT